MYLQVHLRGVGVGFLNLKGENRECIINPNARVQNEFSEYLLSRSSRLGPITVPSTCSLFVANMGWVYNLKNPDAPTHAPRLIAVCAVFSFTALFATAVRFYARTSIKRLPGLDDYATLSSAVSICLYKILFGTENRGTTLIKSSLDLGHCLFSCCYSAYVPKNN